MTANGYCWNCTCDDPRGLRGMRLDDVGRWVCQVCGAEQARFHTTCPVHGEDCHLHPPLTEEDQP